MCYPYIYVETQGVQFEGTPILLRLSLNNVYMKQKASITFFWGRKLILLRNIPFSDSSWETQWSRCTQILSAAYWWCWFLSQQRSLPSRSEGEHCIVTMINSAFYNLRDLISHTCSPKISSLIPRAMLKFQTSDWVHGLPRCISFWCFMILSFLVPS
jgi:hypothetical protein